MDLEVGLENTLEMTVEQQHTAAAMGSGDLEVLATPALVAFLEKTCKDLAGPVIPAESTTVGTRIELDHLKASAPGESIRCHCQVTGLAGRLIQFQIRAESEGRLIAQGSHTRAIVDRGRFLAGINKRPKDESSTVS